MTPVWRVSTACSHCPPGSLISAFRSGDYTFLLYDAAPPGICGIARCRQEMGRCDTKSERKPESGGLLLSRSDDAFHHHDEQDLAFIPSADPAHPPAFDAIAQFCWLVQTEESGLDLQWLQSALGGSQHWFRWYRQGRAGDVEGISLRADVNRDWGIPLGHWPGVGGFSRWEWNDLLSHDMTHYLGLGLSSGAHSQSRRTLASVARMRISKDCSGV